MGKAASNNRRSRGQPEYKRNDEHADLIQMLSAAGVTRELIARAIGISRNTMLKHYRDLLKDSKVIAVGRVAASLYRKCLNGNVTAQIFYLKTQGGWTAGDSGAGIVDPRVPDITIVAQAMPEGEYNPDEEIPSE